MLLQKDQDCIKPKIKFAICGVPNQTDLTFLLNCYVPLGLDFHQTIMQQSSNRAWTFVKHLGNNPLRHPMNDFDKFG